MFSPLFLGLLLFGCESRWPDPLLVAEVRGDDERWRRMLDRSHELMDVLDLDYRIRELTLMIDTLSDQERHVRDILMMDRAEAYLDKRDYEAAYQDFSNSRHASEEITHYSFLISALMSGQEVPVLRVEPLFPSEAELYPPDREFGVHAKDLPNMDSRNGKVSRLLIGRANFNVRFNETSAFRDYSLAVELSPNNVCTYLNWCVEVVRTVGRRSEDEKKLAAERLYFVLRNSVGQSGKDEARERLTVLGHGVKKVAITYHRDGARTERKEYCTCPICEKHLRPEDF